MKRIALVCSAGMSSSLLVKKMEQVAKELGVEVEIAALPEAEAKANWTGFNLILLGPQVRYVKPQFERMVGGKIPVAIIDMAAYGTVNGKKVLEDALKILAEN